jgi:hypothetical protein
MLTPRTFSSVRFFFFLQEAHGASDFETHDAPLPRLGRGATKAERDAYVRTKVDRAIEKIHAEVPLLAQQCEYISTKGRLPPDVVATATAETLDAIGSMHCAVMSLNSQFQKTRFKLKYYLPDEGHGVLQPIRDARAIEEAHLVGGRAVAHKWQLDLAPIAARAPATTVDAKTLCFKLPLAATDPTLGSASSPNELTVQRLLGFYVLTDKGTRARTHTPSCFALRCASSVHISFIHFSIRVLVQTVEYSVGLNGQM